MDQYGIKYSLPKVILLQDTGIGTSEYAARTCYDSFDASENTSIQNLNRILNDTSIDDTHGQHILTNIYVNGNGSEKNPGINNIEHSDLLDQLAWTHFHHSILEHANLTYLIKGTSRGVLQEHARHRIQSISVRSTRYTMQDVLHAFNACTISKSYQASEDFEGLIRPMNLFVFNGEPETIEINCIYDKLLHQLKTLGTSEFADLTLSKEAKEVFKTRIDFSTPKELFERLQQCKSKRNVGDPFKWIVTDNWKVDMVVTMNLRALKNYLTLRDSGAAYFQIRWLAQEMIKVTPTKYLDLIIKKL